MTRQVRTPYLALLGAGDPEHAVVARDPEHIEPDLILRALCMTTGDSARQQVVTAHDNM